MTLPTTSPASAANISPVSPRVSQSRPQSESQSLGRQFEQMLWTEMLSHAGLEKAVTQNGGEAASAFSKFLVEAIAEDLTAKHPLGLADRALPQEAAKIPQKTIE